MKPLGLNVRDYAHDCYPAIAYCLKILLDEKEHREELWKSMRNSNERRKIKKITCTEIDDIVRNAFGVDKEIITAIRINKLDRTKKKHPFKKKFYPRAFVTQCKKRISYDVSKEDLEFISLLLDYECPLRLVSKSSTANLFYEKTQELTGGWLDAVNEACKPQPNASYWNLIFRYMKNLRHESVELIDLLSRLPLLSDISIDVLNQKIACMQSNLSVGELEYREQCWGYLQKFANDMHNLYERKGWDKYGAPCCFDESMQDVKLTEQPDKYDAIDGFKNLTVNDLYLLYCNRDYVSLVARYPLRSQDIEFAYRFVSKLDDKGQRTMLELIEIEGQHSVRMLPLFV